MRNDADRRSRQARLTDTSQHAIRKYNLIILRALREGQKRDYVPDAAEEQDIARAVGVKERADLHAEEKVEEDVDGTDPADL